MTIKIASVMVVALMLLAGVLLFIPTSANAIPVEDDGVPQSVITEPAAMTISQDELNVMAEDMVVLDDGEAAATAIADTTVVSSDPIGTVKTYLTYNTYYNGFHTTKQIEKVGEGTFCEVWVSTNMSFPWGDPRNEFTSRLTINATQLAYIIDEFDDNIYANMSDFFGVPLARNGSEADVDLMDGWGMSDYFNTTDGKKTMIVIENIRDEGYYDSSYPYYVVGFFMSYVDELYDRNIIHIDCWDWANRTGDQSASNPARSYLYEATIAHEYQHLIHNGYDPMEENFVNEGCSDYAELVCGYGLMSLSSHIGNFLDEPQNSLTLWGDGDQLADYGAAALFTIFLKDKFGGASTIQELVRNNKTGIDGVEDTLAKQGFGGWTFDMVFKQWRIANLLDSNQPGNGKYKYDTLNLADIGAMSTDYNGLHTGRSGFLGAYGTDYIETQRGYMRTRERLSTYADFVGLSIDPYTGWEDAGSYWRTNNFDQGDSVVRGYIDLRGTDATTHELSIYTWYNIEDYWDYGFVQVSTDNGATWTSLENAYTTSDYDSGAMDSIVDQLPGLTGYSGGDVWMDFDLSAYDEQFILVQFRYMTDWATTYDGWDIYQINLDGYYYDSASDEDYFAPVYQEIDWYVSVVLFHNDLPIGVVDMKISNFHGIAGTAPSFYEYEWVEMMYKPFKLRAVTSICVVMSPTGVVGSYYEYGIGGPI